MAVIIALRDEAKAAYVKRVVAQEKLACPYCGGKVGESHWYTTPPTHQIVLSCFACDRSWTEVYRLETIKEGEDENASHF